MAVLARAWRTDLPPVILLLQAGNVVNFFGYGLIVPFEIIYLHEFRGFSTATAGLVLGAILGTATVVSPPTGALLDRFRSKPVLIAANVLCALGYAGFALVERPWQAFACAAVAGVGIGAARVATQTLLIGLITPEQRPASFALTRVAQNFGLGVGAAVAGFIVSWAQDLQSCQMLYVFDGLTYVVFALVVLAVVPRASAAAAHAGAETRGFRAVARDRKLLIILTANLVLLIVGYTTFSNLLAPYAAAHTRVGPSGFGITFLFNSAFVVVAQIPATHVVKRLRRGQAFAAASAVFVIALFGVLAATLIRSELAATTFLCAVGVTFAIGECVHNVVMGPVVADLAPTHLLGRYMSLLSLTVSGGFAIGPAIGGAVLASSPDAVWWGGALVAGAIGAGFLVFGDRVPDRPVTATE
jgi:MFS family permease